MSEVFRACAVLLHASRLEGLASDDTRGVWREIAEDARREHDTMREGLRALEVERDGMAKALELARAEIERLRGVLRGEAWATTTYDDASKVFP